jgi:hypothetical protein
MQRSGLGKTLAGLLPLLVCIGWAGVVFVPHSSPYATITVLLLALLGANVPIRVADPRQ